MERPLSDVEGIGSSPRGAQAIVRAIGVLRAYDVDRSTMTITEMAALLSVSLPTAHRIAKTLESQGLLARDHASKAFSLGPEILRLAKLITESGPAMFDTTALAAIRDRTGETVSLQVRVGDRRVCIAEEVSRRPIRITSGVGQSYPLGAGAAGKAILSLLPDDEVTRLVDLPPDAGSRPLARHELLAAIARTRDRGHARSDGETVPGSIAVAVPIPPVAGNPPAAVNLVGPRARMMRGVIEDGLAAIRAALPAPHGSKVGA